MAHLNITPLHGKKSEEILLAAGYVNVASCSEKSVWRFHFYHELELDVGIYIKDDNYLRDLAFREGLRIGDALGRQKLKDRIVTVAQNFLNEIA